MAVPHPTDYAMNRVLFLALLALVGCKKPVPDSPPPADPVPAKAVSVAPAAPGKPPAGPPKKLIEAGAPEFDAMLAKYKADPKTKKFEREIITFVMAVDSVKEINKTSYQVTGKGSGLNLVCTFILPPNLPLNDRVKSLQPGDQLTYMAQPASYKAGSPPMIVSLSGSILGVESKN
jgi:hypothetical protein